MIPLRDGALEVIANPGTHRGHVVFRHTDTRILFSGNHIPPRITPSIGFEWAPEPYPLRSYLRSLELVRGLPDTALLPSHGPVTSSTHDRVDELLHHHRERLDELPPEHQLSAVMEISAHLDVLTLHGRLNRTGGTTTHHYGLSR